MTDAVFPQAAEFPAEGQELWRPSDAFKASTNLGRFEDWLKTQKSRQFADYEALWNWSTEDLSGFWEAIWQYFDIQSSVPYREVLSGDEILGARWFDGARVNYAEHVLRAEASEPGKIAIFEASEGRPLESLSWGELGARVRVLAQNLRALGLEPGDRVAAYLPNVAASVVAMLAVTAVGGVWAAASPEFGASTVLDRVEQIEPKFAIMADGYRFGGSVFDRRAEALAIQKGLKSLTHVLWFDYLSLEPPELAGAELHLLRDLWDGGDTERDAFRYARMPADHPLWILFSSGTTGKPKAIVHSHVGIVVEHYKYNSLHNNLGPDDCAFYFTTTGWMAWNITVSALMTGASILTYDGSPIYAGADCLWRLVEAAGVTHMAAGPALVQQMNLHQVRPAEQFNLDRLKAVLLGGAPCAPEHFAWFYRNVKQDLWVFSQSGGTELCGAVAGGVPGRPCYAGEIPGRLLGMRVDSWNDAGQMVVDEVGELVITRPFPSAPLHFWGDHGDERYRDTYFSTWPGVWKHGDRIRINDRGGCYIYGRSDATLNRHGVRIGSSEIYDVVMRLPGVRDSLVICCDLEGGGFYMPLFVELEDGYELGGDLKTQIESALRDQASPRHVPDEIVQTPQVPYTLTGKKMEVPVRRILMGANPDAVASRDAVANPAALDWYHDFRVGRDTRNPDTGAARHGLPG